MSQIKVQKAVVVIGLLVGLTGLYAATIKTFADVYVAVNHESNKREEAAWINETTSLHGLNDDLLLLNEDPWARANRPMATERKPVGEWHTVENTGYLVPYLPARRMIAADSALDEFGNFVPGCYGVDPATGQLNREPAERNHASSGELFCGWADRAYQADFEAGQ